MSDKYTSYNQSAKGKERKARYRAANGQKISSAKYQAKPFIAIGSQSVHAENGQLKYVHLALSTGQSLTNLDGITTNQALNFITANIPPASQAITVIYGSTYDFNFWLEAANREQLETIYTGHYATKPVPVGFYKIKLARGQAITIYDLFDTTRTISDVYNFFQKPLNETVFEYTGKTVRGGNTYERAVNEQDLPAAAKQLQYELKAIVEVMTLFRQRLDKVNLRPKTWSGAGSITSALFERHKIKNHMAEQETDIAQKARYAYAGGRFELIRYGTMKQSLSYGYDINSAYPEALTKLPSLKGGRWIHVAGDPGDADFGLYEIKITSGRYPYWATPLFTRTIDGTINYPNHATGWYWSPEIAVVREWAQRTGGTYEIEQAYLFDPATETKPFSWITDLYNERLKLQQAGDEAEVGLKLALNSAYGKLAQQVGWIPEDENNALRVPTYHQLEWAGFVTSYTRAKIFRAALENPNSVIAFETDALYSSEELTGIIIGDGLGEWKETVYTELTYLNSGIYYGTKANGHKVYKLRGIQAGTLPLNELELALYKPEETRTITVKQNRFISAALALQSKALDKWLAWNVEDVEIKLYPAGKRIHYLCSCPDDGHALTQNFWHTTIPAKPYRDSYEYSVEWINPVLEQITQRAKNKINRETLI